MSSNSDATPAYRGYRLQALYTLNRILNRNPDNDFIFQPEGNEDLAIFDVEGNLLEIIQVKERTHNLSLSSFEPEKEDSFFYRIAKEIAAHPDAEISIIAFGNVGPEIQKAIQTEGSQRKNVVKKLSSHEMISEDVSSAIFEKINLNIVNEAELTTSVFSELQDSLVGIDPSISFDLLMQWLSICSEQKIKITRKELIEKINKVGSFLASRAAHHQQWFTTVIPIEDSTVDAANKAELENEFYKGVSTRYEHILANVDVIREEKIQEISSGFKDKRIVIVHAASGQGKTTLAYRYLHEHFPQEWRFRIQSVFNREHALSVALALASHADAIGVPMAIYIDVSAQDRDWTELVKQLSVHRNIRVLVTLREEDWRRANISNTDFDFQNIELNLDRNEAEKIYSSLATKSTPVNVLDFEDAWNKFGESGPLMEFIYLVTQGSSLQDRLSQQISFLENEVREGRLSDAELKLLRLTAVTSSYEARLKLKPLVEYLNLTAPKNTLNLFEKEYLLRVSKDGELVDGLHPIRSAILSELLSDPTFSPWSESAGESLAFIKEQDLETFLLYSFSRHFHELEKPLQTFSLYQPQSWLAISGCIRALVWLGLAKYIEANRGLIQEAVEKLGKGLWSYLLDFDIAEVLPSVGSSWWKDLGDLFPEETVKTIEDLQSRQTDKKDVFINVTEWLINRTEKPTMPETEADWEAFAETMFWLKKLDVVWNLPEWFSDDVLNEAVNTLSIETLANLIYSLSFDGRFNSWIEANKPSYIKRFREELLIVGLEEIGQKISAHYIFDFNKLNNSSDKSAGKVPSSENMFHWETLKRINLLRRFLPSYEEFAIQGYGQMLWKDFLPHDDSIKTGIAKKHLPVEWLVSINANFSGLGNLNFRPETWREYADLVWTLRKTILESLKQLKNSLEVYFSKNVFTEIRNELNFEEWENSKKLLNTTPFLPKVAVDEWGISTESTANSLEEIQNTSVIKRNILSLQKYKTHLKTFGEHTGTLSNFFTQALDGIILQPYLGRARNRLMLLKVAKDLGIKATSPNLATYNFSDAIKNLRQFQERSRNILTPFFEKNEINQLENEERKVFNQIFPTWYFFATKPQKVLKNVTEWSAEKTKQLLGEIRQNISQKLRRISTKKLKISIFSEDILWEESSALWITTDAEEILEAYQSFAKILNVVRESVDTIPDDRLRYYILDIYWSNIVIIPLLKGKYLKPVAWRINIHTLTSKEFYEDAKWWNFAQVPIPDDALQQLNLSALDLPDTQNVENLLTHSAVLYALTGHIRDFLRLPELDDEGNNILQKYVSSLSQTLSETLTSLLNVIEELATEINTLPIEILTQNHTILEIGEIMIEFRQYVAPFINFENSVEENVLQVSEQMNIQELSDWADSLEKAQLHALYIYLSWVSYIANKSSNQFTNRKAQHPE